MTMPSLDEQIIQETVRMSAELLASGDSSLYGPNPFWKSLCDKHSGLIRRFGFANFKRTVNFEYHQWGVTSQADGKIKCLKRLLRFHPIRLLWALAATTVDRSDTSGIRWPDVIDASSGEAIEAASEHSQFPAAYVTYTGLLWQYALMIDRLRCLHKLREPLLGRPLPIYWRGRLISQDLALSAIELNLLARFADLGRSRTVAEIGAGYGRFAYVALSRFSGLEYSIFDIPPAAAMSKAYLKETGISGVTIFSPSELQSMPDRHFEIVINVSSFDEMSPWQVENYFALIDRKCRGLLYVKGHTTSRSPGLRLGVSEFPYRSHWKILYDARDPVCPHFTERICRISD